MFKAISKPLAIVALGLALTLGSVSLVHSAERDVDVPLLMLDGTQQIITFEGVPDNVQIPVCEQTSKKTIICAVIEDGLVRPLIISVEQEI